MEKGKQAEETITIDLDQYDLPEEVKDFITLLMYDLEEQEEEAKLIRGIARNQRKIADEQHIKIDQLKKENHALKQFIVDHVDEEKQKLIFKS